MAGVKPEEAERFYEEDEDPARVFAHFDAGQTDQTKRPVHAEPPPAHGKLAGVRERVAMALRRAADIIEPPRAVHSGKRSAAHGQR